MTISSWDAALYLGALLDMSIDESTEIATGLVPEEYYSDLNDFVAKSVIGLDKKSLLTGAMVASIIRDKAIFTPVGDDGVVTCVICGNHMPVPATPDDEFGWVCSECEHIYNMILEMDMRKAIKRDEYENKGGIHRDEKHAKKVLLEGFGVRPYVYYFDADDFGDDEYITGRIKGVTIVYPVTGQREVLRKVVAMAMANATVDGDNFMYAGNLRNELEYLGFYGISIWDYRDKTMYKSLARTVATGRLRKAYERGCLKRKEA